MLGDLRTSLNHAEIGLTFLRNNHDSIGHEASILKVNFVSFIAEIYQALLQPERAQQILVDNPVNLEGDTSSFSDAFCLQAELQLEEQEKINPDSKFYDYCEKTKDQIRPLLIQARLRARANDFHGALAVFQSALSHLLDSEQSHLDPNSSCLSSSTYNAIVDSALELYQWNAALEWSQKAIKTAPNEPLPHLLLVKALILRSEFHLLSQQLDVIRNLPPQNDLPEPDQTIFNQEITRVDQLLQQCPDTNDVGSDNDRTNLINPTFCRWQARGKSIFGQTSEISQGIKTLSELIEHHKIQVSRHTPGDVAAQMNALMRMHGNGKDNSRLSTAIQVAQKFHNYPLVMLHLSCALIDRHPQEALRAAQMAKSLTYDSEHPIALLANYLLARLAHQVGETTLATQAIEAAISVWPDEPRWHALAADIYKAAGNVSLAIPHLEEAVRFESRHVPYHIALGNAYLTSAAQDGLAIKRAIRAFERACKLAPDLIDPWIELAQSQRSAGDLAAADATIDQTIQAFPENITPLILKAEISLNQNMPQEAQDYIHKALNIDPDHPSALLVQARLMRNQNRVNEAIKILERAILRAEDPIPLHIERSKLLFITKGADAAIDSLRDVLDHNPNHVDILEQ
jgi:tetratricopeptide (TPR) repeat protein